MTSYITKLQNEIHTLEKECDKYISNEYYYIINIQIPVGNLDLEKIHKINALGKKILVNTEHQPLAVYVSSNTLSLVHSCIKKNEIHYLAGSYSKIISKYVSLVSRKLKTNVVCSIIQFENQVKVVTYFSCKVYGSFQEYCSRNLDINLSVSDNSITKSELLEKLKDKGVIWENIPGIEKFGVFYKLKRKKNKTVISSMSELFNARNLKKYTNYFFGG